MPIELKLLQKVDLGRPVHVVAERELPASTCIKKSRIILLRIIIFIIIIFLAHNVLGDPYSIF